MTFDMKTIGINIRTLRNSAGLSQKHIAEYLSVDQSLISKFEAGERAISSDMLDKLVALFCCSISELLSPDDCKTSIVFAFRTTGIDNDDLYALSVINRIALNQMQMDIITGGMVND